MVTGRVGESNACPKEWNPSHHHSHCHSHYQRHRNGRSHNHCHRHVNSHWHSQSHSLYHSNRRSHRHSQSHRHLHIHSLKDASLTLRSSSGIVVDNGVVCCQPRNKRGSQVKLLLNHVLIDSMSKLFPYLIGKKVSPYVLVFHIELHSAMQRRMDD